MAGGPKAEKTKGKEQQKHGIKSNTLSFKSKDRVATKKEEEQEQERPAVKAEEKAEEKAAQGESGLGTSNDVLGTYTIITVPASSDLAWLHDRMPAVLPTREAVMAWLDVQHTPLMSALKLLQPYEGLGFYPVSSRVRVGVGVGALG